MPRTFRAARATRPADRGSPDARSGPPRVRALALAVVGIALGATPTARGNDFLWDANGATAGEGGAGNWTAAGVSWFGDHDGDGNPSFVAWPNTLTDNKTDAVAVFGATNAATVNVTAAGIRVNGLAFDAGGWTLGGAQVLTLHAGNVFSSPILSVANEGTTSTVNAPLALAAGVSEWIKVGGGTLHLGGNNAGLTGRLLIADGALSFAAPTALGSTSTAVISSSGALRYTGTGASTIAPVITTVGAFDVSSATGRLTVNLDPTFTNTITKRGVGTLALTSASNTAVTLVSVQEGTVSVANPDFLSATPAISLGTATTAGTIFVDAPGMPFTIPINMAAGGGGIGVGSGTLERIAGPTGGPAPVDNSTPATATGLSKVGAGVLRLSGSSTGVLNTFTGNTVVRAGTLEILGDGDLGHVTNGVTLDGGVLRAIGGWAQVNGAPAATGIFDPGPLRIFRIGNAGGTLEIGTSAGPAGGPATFILNDGLATGPLPQLQSLNPITGANALNPNVASPDVLTKKGPGNLYVGSPGASHAASFTGTTVIADGLVRLDGPDALGLRQISVTNDLATGGAGRLASNTSAPVSNRIVLANGGVIGATGGDRVFSGPIVINTNTTLSSQDLADPAPIDRTITLTGPVTDNGRTITLTGNIGNISKGVVLANFTGTPSNLTGQWLIEPRGMLAVGGRGTGAGSVTGLSGVQVQNNVQLQTGGTFGFRSDEATTFGAYPAFPGTNFNLSIGPLSNPLARNVTLPTGPLNLNGQTVAVHSTNGYRLAPSTMTPAAGTTLDLLGAAIIPGQLNVTGTVNLTGDSFGQLIINNEAGGPHNLAGATFDLKPGGRLTLQGGTAGNDPLHGAALLFNGGTLALSSTNGGAVFDRPATLPNGAIVQHIGTNTNRLIGGGGSLGIAAGANARIDVAGGTLILNPISGGGTITKTGPGTLVIPALPADTGGGVNISAGVLKFSNAQNSVGGTLGVHGGIVDLDGGLQTVPAVQLTGGSIVNGQLATGSITKTGAPGSVATIDARISPSPGALTVNRGVLRLTNNRAGPAANFMSDKTVAVTAGGVLEVHHKAGGSDPLAGVSVNLDGGTLRLAGVNSSAPGLLGNYVSVAPFYQAFYSDASATRWLSSFNSTLVAPTTTGGQANLDFTGPTTPFNGVSTLLNQGFARNTDYMVRYAGKINISPADAAAGPILFQTTSDDGTMLYIDGRAVAFNNFDQGATERGGYVELSPGVHDIAVTFLQGGGGGGMFAVMTPFGGVRTIIPNSALSSDGGVTVSNDINVAGSSALGFPEAHSASVGALSITNGSLALPGGSLTVASLAVSGNAVVETSGTATVYAPSVSESSAGSSLTKSGPGTLSVAGAISNTGSVTIDGGILRVNQSNAFAGGGGPITVNGGGTLEAAAPNVNLSRLVVNAGGRVQISQPQSIGSGAAIPTTPIAGTYEVRTLSMGNQFNGVRLAAGATILFNPNQAGLDRTYNSTLVLEGPGQVFLNNSNPGNATIFNGSIGGSGGLTVLGGTNQLEAVSTFSGPLDVEGGILRVRNAGAVLNVPTINLYGGEANVSDNTGTTAGNRIADSATVNAYNGSLSTSNRLNGGTNTEVIGTLNVAGNLTINSTSAGANGIAALQFNTLSRATGGRVSFTGTNLGTTSTQRGEVRFAAPPGQTGGIIPWATVGNGDFATYGANGVTALTTYAGADQGTWNASANVKIPVNTAVTLAGPAVINAMVFNSGTGNANLNLNGDLSLFSGALLFTGDQNISVNTGGGRILTTAPALFLSYRTGTADRNVTINSALGTPNAPTAVVAHVTGGNANNVIRLASEANSFTGGLFISGTGQVTAQTNEADRTGRTLGAGPVILNGGRLNLRDNGTASNATVAYGNAVTVNANAQIDVNRIDGTNTNNTFSMGALALGSGRSLSLTGGNSYRLSFSSLALGGTGGTIDASTAPAAISGPVMAPAGATLVKAGAGTLTLSGDSAATFSGKARVAAGELQIAHANALGTIPVVHVDGGSLAVNVADLNLSQTTLGPAGGLRLMQVQSNPAFRPATLSVSNLGLGATAAGTGGTGPDYDGLRIVPGGSVTVNNEVASSHTLAGDITLLGPSTWNQTSPNNNTVTVNGVISGPGGINATRTSGIFHLVLDAANTYTGGTRIIDSSAQITASKTGALGAGPVDVTSGALTLSAPAAADNTVTVTNGSLLYSATNAAGDNVVTAAGGLLNSLPATSDRLVAPAFRVGQVMISGGDVSSFGGDTFVIRAGNIIDGSPETLAKLNRNASGTHFQNITLEPGAIIMRRAAETSGSSIQDLGTAGDLLYGIFLDHTGQDLAVGAGTPWKGVSAGVSTANRFRSGTLTIGDGTTEITLQAAGAGILQLGEGPGNAVNIVKPVGAAVPANIFGRVVLDSAGPGAPTANFSGVSQFVVREGGALQLARGPALGGAGGTSPVPVLVKALGTIDPGGDNVGNTLNAAVTIERDGVLQLNDNKNLASSSGAITPHAGSIVLIENGSNNEILANAAGNGAAAAITAAYNSAATPAGVVVRLGRNDVRFLNEAFADTAIFQAFNGSRTFFPIFTGSAAGLDISGGGLTNDQSARDVNLASGQLASLANSIRVGPGGATFSSTTGVALQINVPIEAVGNDITIGTNQRIAGFDKFGMVRLQGANTRLNNLTVAHGSAELANEDGDAFFITGAITVKSGATLRLQGNRIGLGNALRNGPVVGANPGIGGIVVEKGATLDVRVRTDNNLYNTPITLSGAGTGANILMFDEDVGAGIATLNNVTFASGSEAFVFVRDMARGEARINARATGSTTVRTATGTEFSLAGLANTSPVDTARVTLGSLADQRFFITEAIAGNVGGAGQGPLEIDQVRGGLFIAQGVTVGANVTINNLGSQHTPVPAFASPQSATLFDGAIEIRAGQTGVASEYPAAAINLGGGRLIGNVQTAPGDLRIFVNAGPAGATPLVNRLLGPVNVIADGFAHIQADRGNAETAVPGQVRLASLNLAADSSTILTAALGTNVEVGAVNVTGSAVLTPGGNAAADINLRAITAGVSALTLNGGPRTRITGNVAAGQLVANAENLTFDAAAAGGTITVASPVKNPARITFASGVTDLGANVISGQPRAAGAGAGLFETRVGGDFNRVSNTTGGVIRPSPVQANLASASTDAGYAANGWVSNSTFVYTGEVFIPDTNGNGTGTIGFAEQFDDSVEIKVGGVVRLTNTVSGTATTTGAVTVPTGWHEIEFRLGQGSGGAGASAAQAWPAGLGLVGKISTSADTYNTLPASYPPNLDAMQFRPLTPASGRIDVSPGATLLAGGLQDLQDASILGSATVGPVNVRRVTVGNAAAPASLTASHIRGDALTIRNNAAVTLSPKPQGVASRVAALTFDGSTALGWQGKLDLANNAIVVEGGNLANINSQVRQGYGAGDWNGLAGITSSTAAVDAADGLSGTGVAAIRNSDNGTTPLMPTFGGLPVTAASILVRHTYHGDSDLSGSLDADDLMRSDRGFVSQQDGTTGNDLTGYRWGDVNYDGRTNISDLFLIDVAWTVQDVGGPLVLADIGPAAAGAPAPLSASASVVPEPATLLLPAAGALGLLRRRRCRA